ncbi:MAG TPA: response regulator transcription factor [Candidatus Brocadiia bacterium]|nr:response regulator [Planctomycetota bacterium]MDO8092584.1 response regulator [Candidatus Brocadiales bacterium]
MNDKKRILIVEDDPALTHLMKLSFEKESFEVDTASDGLMGLNKAREGMPDLIILNVMMPRMDGYHVCRFLKFDQKYMHIPIIMVTGKTHESERQTGIEVGADEYIFKPFDIDKLIATVQKYVM